MSAIWERVRLGEVLKRATEVVTLSPESEYREVTVRLWGKGVVPRGTVSGSQIAGTRRFVARAGQFILSRIDARNGAVGIVPEQLDGAVVTNDFPLFNLDRSRLDPAFFAWLSRARAFLALCNRASEGTTNRVRLQEDEFLALEVPLPPLAEQQRIAARVEEVAAKIADARQLREQAQEAADALIPARTSVIFSDLSMHAKVPIKALGPGGVNPIQTGPFGAQLHASDFVEAGVPVLNVGNVWPEGLKLERLDHVTPQKAAQLRRYSLRPGDLLFARSGATLGKVCLVPNYSDGWLMTGHLFRVRFDPARVLDRFAFAAFRGARSVHDQIFGQIRGATRPGYNTTLLGNVEIPLPPLAEQQRIVDELDALQVQVDSLERLQAKTAAEIDALLPAILDLAFNGAV